MQQVEEVGHLELADGGEQSGSVGPQPAALLTQAELHREEITLKQRRDFNPHLSVIKPLRGE